MTQTTATPKFKVGETVRFQYSSDSYSRPEVVKEIRRVDCRFEYQIGNVWAKEEFLFPVKEVTDTTNDSYEQYQKAMVDELNLIEILKGYEGEEFYCLNCGNCKLTAIKPSEVGRDTTEALTFDYFGNEFGLRWDGKEFSGGLVLLYPDAESYEENPLDPRAAWRKWRAEHIPHRWRAKAHGQYWYVTSDLLVGSSTDLRGGISEARYRCGNYFRTQELAKQAAEAAVEYLTNFHQPNNQ